MPIENTISFDTARKPQAVRVELVPRSRNQEHLVLDLLNDQIPIVIVSGPAGTGKTYLAMLAAVRALKAGLAKRIVLTRPAVGVEDERHGFLPGNLNDKMEPWTRPLIDVLRLYYRPQDVGSMIENNIIEIAPLAFMRGRTFQDSWIVADEMQNATPSQVKMLMTRIGKNAKIVITGDVEQTDRKRNDNGLLDIVQRLEQSPVKGISVVALNSQDTQRHRIIPEILALYQQ